VAKAGRNDPCPCGSGLKAKACCLSRGPLDPAAILVSQPSPAAKLAARWLSAARRRCEGGQAIDDTLLRKAEQFLRVSRGWNPDAFDEQGYPRGDLALLASAFSGQAAAVYGVLAIGLAHLLLDQRAEARAWLDTLAGPREERMLTYLAAGGLPRDAFAGLPDAALRWVDESALPHAGSDPDGDRFRSPHL